jgi:hypothetical protein
LDDVYSAKVKPLLESMGSSGEDRIRALRGFRSMVHRFSQLEVIGEFRTQVDRDASFERMVRAFVNAIGHQVVGGRADDRSPSRQPLLRTSAASALA